MSGPIPRRPRRAGRGRRRTVHSPPPALALVLIVLSLGAAACTTPASRSTTAPPVLGQTSGSASAIGQPAPAGTGQLDAISCASRSHCWAVGTPPAAGTTPAVVIDATTDGGHTWHAQATGTSTLPALSGIACPAVADCMAVGTDGANGEVLTTQDGGADWAPASAPAGAVVVSAVACRSVTDCTVLASDGPTVWSARSRDFGLTWQRQGTLPAGLQDAGAIWCAATTCLATGFTATATAGQGEGAVVITMDGGTTWTASDVPAGTGLLQAVTCADTLDCLAVGTTSGAVSGLVPARGQVLRSLDDGQDWTRLAPTTAVDDIFAVACPGRRRCAMVGTHWTGKPPIGAGAVARSRDDGRSFTAAVSAYTPLSLTALACPAATGCIAVGGNTIATIALTGTTKQTGLPTPPTQPTPVRHFHSNGGLR